jgi:drug/metabolite transporter (DMT)-like permease
MGVIFGVVSALCWGLGDYFITLLTRRLGTSRALLFIQILSLCAWIGFLVARPRGLSGDWTLWALLVATGVCHVAGLAFVYRAFEIGTLSIVSPISAGFAVVTALLALATGERPPLSTLVGALVLILGVVLATRSASSATRTAPTLAGVPEAIVSALGFGTMFWLFYFHVQPRLGYGWPLVGIKTMAVAWSLFTVLASEDRKKTVSVSAGLKAVLLAVAAAGADTAAWLAYIRGTETTYATVVTALASLFSVVTILLAALFLRERLARHQWAGVGLILLGILLVSV